MYISIHTVKKHPIHSFANLLTSSIQQNEISKSILDLAPTIRTLEKFRRSVKHNLLSETIHI